MSEKQDRDFITIEDFNKAKKEGQKYRVIYSKIQAVLVTTIFSLLKWFFTSPVLESFAMVVLVYSGVALLMSFVAVYLYNTRLDISSIALYLKVVSGVNFVLASLVVWLGGIFTTTPLIFSIPVMIFLWWLGDSQVHFWFQYIRSFLPEGFSFLTYDDTARKTHVRYIVYFYAIVCVITYIL